MRGRTFLLALSCLLISNAFIQPAFAGKVLKRLLHGKEKTKSVLETIDHRDRFYDIEFVEETGTLWVVGSPGRMLSSTDKGQTFKLHDTKTAEAIFSLKFPTANLGVAVGSQGIVLRTTDGGKNWKLLDSLCKEPLFELYMVDDKYGWAVGHFSTIFHTKDGGETWERQEYELPEDAVDEPGFNSAYFIDRNTGWIAGEFGTVIRTDDGGETWTKQETNLVKPLYSIQFQSPTHGRIVGAETTVLTTEDGGVTWVRQPSDSELHLFDFTIQPGTEDDPVIFDVGQEGRILRNGKNLPNKIYTWLVTVMFLDGQTGFVAGGRGHILVTRDGGKSWTRISGK